MKQKSKIGTKQKYLVKIVSKEKFMDEYVVYDIDGSSTSVNLDFDFSRDEAEFLLEIDGIFKQKVSKYMDDAYLIEQIKNFFNRTGLRPYRIKFIDFILTDSDLYVEVEVEADYNEIYKYDDPDVFKLK